MSSLAKARARKLLQEYCITKPAELALNEIAFGEKLFVQEQLIETHIGRINYRDGFGLITVSNLINEPAQKRFVIAHEIGHYFNERNKHSGISGCMAEDLYSFKSKKELEAEANSFASELLMPEEWFKDFTRAKKFSYKHLIEITEYFNVSLSAAALKYGEIGSYPTAIIMSKNGKVIWSIINSYFPFKWIPMGYEVNNNSYAYDIFEMYKQQITNDKQIPISSEPSEVLADAWFWNDNNYKKNYPLMEYNIPMPRYDSVLTILWEE